jgi:hypothetical protein
MDEGRWIEIKPLSQNAFFSIRDNLESHSNVTDVNVWREEKDVSEIISTEDGIQTR